MDLGVAPRCSFHLARLPPSTSPSPLGERNRQYRQITSHIDSHTMGDHIEGISKPPSPIQVDDGEFTPSYDPSLDLIELGPVIFEIGTFHDRPAYSSYDPPFMHRWYGMSNNETQYEPASTSYGSYGMSSIPTHDLTFHVESKFELNTTPGGTPIPYHAERFGSTSHIAPSIRAVEATSYVHPRPGVSNPIRIPEPR